MGCNSTQKSAQERPLKAMTSELRSGKDVIGQVKWRKDVCLQAVSSAGPRGLMA